MFLKRIEMQGFKSFADQISIPFEHAITGIVGPNGCGKSNISDAIRWVLGEQSTKSMRGNSMTDIIFNGTETRKKVNLAQVTLVFDNHKKSLNSHFEEVEVTRRLYRDTKESEYLINKTPCRLRDIHDLVLDTGLGRDSLSIVSQGTISFFAEAKPMERRLIFEEAAGVSKYKKRKIESINKLERTRENLERMQDIVSEIEHQLSGLKRAAKKAELYLKRKERLEAVEVSFLCREIELAQAKLKQENDKYYDLSGKINELETRKGVYEHDLESKRQEIFELDQSLQKDQEQLLKILNEISQLETRKAEVDERRKYTLAVGNQEAKLIEMNHLLQEAKTEYEERLKRQESLSESLETVNLKIRELNASLQKDNETVEAIDRLVQNLRQRLGLIEQRLNRPFEGNAGIQAILSNRNSLYGIHDVVERLLLPHDHYEIAIATALAASSSHIVTQDDKAAVNAINFLKKNQSGRASFMPLSVLKPRSIYSDVLAVAQSTKGYLGLACDFVGCEDAYQVLRDNLLGNVLLVDTIENASILAKRIAYRTKIVSLDGDVIHSGGVMSGGKSRSQTHSSHALEKEKDILQKEFERKQNELLQAENRRQKHQTFVHEENATMMQYRIALAQLVPLLDVKRAKYERLIQEVNELKETSNIKDIEVPQDDITVRLNKAYMQKDELTSKISLDREKRYNLAETSQSSEKNLKETRQDLTKLKDEIHQFELSKTKLEAQIDNSLQRLSTEYQMTLDYALEHIYDVNLELDRSEILKLRSDLQAMGNVNLEAPEAFIETQTRYDFLSAQLEDLFASRDKLLAIIEEMDTLMIKQFKEMFDKINFELKDVFTALFGGGHARLVLEDEGDLLNTGIDIDVQPPGKSVQNIRLFSGGEKSLIVISVLFAMLKARHVPLCIFDEVEAALDPVNVERLANYIRHYKEDTQFIIITHRPGTMAQTDTLYGVTMPNKGISTILRVKLEDALNLKEDH